MSRLLIIGFAFWLFSCSITNDQIKYDEKLTSCLSEKDSLTNGLMEFGQYLVKTNRMKDLSGKSILNFYKRINDSGVLPFESLYYNPNLPYSSKYQFFECWVELKNDSNFQKSESKWKHIHNDLIKIVVDSTLKTKEFSQVIIKHLTEQDFNQENFKIYFLGTLYYSSIKNPEILILLTKNQDIIINEKNIKIDSLESEILSIRSKYKIEDLTNSQLVLQISPKIKMKNMIELKKIIHKNSIKNISVITLDE